jgi:F420H(2)-dependent biliverdin reductase
MATELTSDLRHKLESAKVLWFTSVRPNGRPHLAPVWYVWLDEKIYIGTDPGSVKIRNLRANPNVVLALEDGTHPVICEGEARILPKPLPETLKSAFFQKYEWDLDADPQFNMVVETTPRKWLSW